MNVAQKQKLRVFVFRWNARLKFLEHVQFGEVGFGLTKIVGIASAPTEGLTFFMLDATRVHAAPLEDILMLGGEVLSHHGDHADAGEVARRKRKIGRRTAEHILSAAGCSRDVVKG